VPPKLAEPDDVPPSDLGAALIELTGRLNVAPDEEMARHYDHEVKALTVVKPFVGVHRDVPAEATVFLVRHGSNRGYVLSEGVNPLLSDLDAYWMAQSVVDLAIRRQLCAGARLDRIALLDNFCWPDPVESDQNEDGTQKLAQLVRACRGLFEAAVAYGSPLISGKDSMKNDSTMGGVRISVPPTLLVSALGQIDDVRDAVTLGFEQPGDVIYLLGTTHDELGGSEWYRYRGERAGRRAELGQPAPFVGTKPPKLDLGQTLPLYRAFGGAFDAGLVRSASTPALGGLALALVRSALAGDLGAELDLDRAPDLAALAADVALFSESNGRFVVTVAERDAESFERTLAPNPCVRLGRVTDGGKLSIRHGGGSLIDIVLDALRAAFRRSA
jgi:phosphoribosylformylglycinamidine synthase